MSRYTQFTKDLGEKIAELAKPAQDAYVDVLSTVSGTVGEFVPAIPLSESVPTLREVVETGFDVWEQVLRSQREFALRVIGAIAPITSKYEAQPQSKPKVAAA